jgi:hypothetical protein
MNNVLVPLVMTPEVDAALKAIREYAERPENANDLRAIANGERDPVATADRNLSTTISTGNPNVQWCIIYSIDINGPHCPLKHLSISFLGLHGIIPSQDAVPYITEAMDLEAPDIMLVDDNNILHCLWATTPEGKRAFAEMYNDAVHGAEVEIPITISEDA